VSKPEESSQDWRALNRANWDERVAIHLKPTAYDLKALRAGRGELNPVEEAEIGEVKGLKVLHLQCHFGADTLCLAQRGATVVGLDFSAPAIAAARALAVELGLAERARFVQSDLYDAPSSIAEPASFDLVYTSWGATCWLPDIRRWAGIVAHFLKPGGRLYYADAHPAAYVFDDLARLPDGKPGYFAPYFERKPLVMVDHKDYADPTARLVNATNVNWLHPLSDIVGGLIDAGLSLDWLHEHAQVPWRMFEMLVKEADGDWHWPDRQWLPLAVSLQATLRTTDLPALQSSRAG
jgi:SAM-dependent methyltransferase